MRTILLSLLCSLPALAAFPKTEQTAELGYGQKNVTLVFQADCPVTSARPLCDCTKVAYKGRVLTAQVDVSAFDRSVDKQIEAKTADGKKTTLTMHLQIPPALVLSSRSFVWERGGDADERTLRITLPKGSPVTALEEAGLNGEAFRFNTACIRPGAEYAVTVAPLSTAKRVLNRLVLTTKSSDPRFSRQIIYLQVK